LSVTLSAFDVAAARRQFRSLSQTWGERTAVFFDNPGGTQVPDTVIEAVARYYREQNANVGGAFPTSQRTDDVVTRARQDMADLLNAASPHEIVFGANMTTLTFHLARSLADTIHPGDEILITNLDHDANVTPWTDLQAQGAIIKVVDIDPDDCTLPLENVRAALTERTRLVAVTHASNAVGTIPDVAAITRLAHEADALVFVDAVQYAPHGPIDVQALDCDFLACSAYKFFGPHIGILYGKAHLLETLKPHKVRPSKNAIPYRWETGTLNHEGLAGVSAAVNYLATLSVIAETGESLESSHPSGHKHHRHDTLAYAMQTVKDYEQSLAKHLLARLQEFDDLTTYGITDPARLHERVPTVAFTWPRLSPRATAEHLAQYGIAVWSGNYYALRLMERLGLEAEGGAVRIGLAHYNTREEVDRLIDALHEVKGK
jgi:cysteine desulfurase family protein (TIGR01976 family)